METFNIFNQIQKINKAHWNLPWMSCILKGPWKSPSKRSNALSAAETRQKLAPKHYGIYGIPFFIANCKRRRPTVLHTSPPERLAVDVGVGTEDVISTQAYSHMVKTGTSANSGTLGEGRMTGMAVITVKVRANDSDESVITYSFLDNGNNSSFCPESLMKQLGINGQQVKISLSTLEKKNSITNSFLVRDLPVSDLDENEWISLPTLYTRPEIPVSSSDILAQEDVDQWPTCKEFSCLVLMLKLAALRLTINYVTIKPWIRTCLLRFQVS